MDLLKIKVQENILNKQGDLPHPDKNPSSLVNFTNYPHRISIDSYQASNPLEEGANINNLDKIHLQN